MPQTVVSVVAEVQPASAGLLRERIVALRRREEEPASPGDAPYARLASAVPSLHFMSMTVFEDAEYDPVLVLEANFDGAPGPFWSLLEAAIGAELRDMFRCCKPPRGRGAATFRAVVEPGSRAPVAPLLEAFSVRPLVHHQGNRGLDRERILREGELFLATRKELEGIARPALGSASEVHRRLRAALLPAFPWLDAPAPRRIGVAENAADWVRLLAIPALAVGLALWRLWPDVLSWAALRWLAAVLATAAAVVALLAGWVRRLERADPATDAPRVDPEALRAMVRREDHIAQNHMISLVHLKPGVLRAVVVRVALPALGLYLRVAARNGYLASMRTIHFAHWALVGNGGRLMFHSNYDGSWESYLDDFIEKAHGGLTLAWSGGIGFPPTRFLFLDGATDGRRFKAWGRHSMAESQLWFSGYKSYSVNQIERHARVASGLRRPTLGEAEATEWAIDL
jgi:hypothetical protein